MEQKLGFTLILITLQQEAELSDAGWKYLTGVSGKAKSKIVTKTITVNTNNIYYLLSSYYVLDSLLNILYASLHNILTWPSEENSAIESILLQKKWRIIREIELPKVTKLVSAWVGFPTQVCTAHHRAFARILSTPSGNERPMQKALEAWTILHRPFGSALLILQKSNMTLILATIPERVKPESQEEFSSS